MPHVGKIQQAVDRIYFGDSPYEVRDAVDHLLKDQWLKQLENDHLAFGERGGGVIGLSVEREGVSWAVPGANNVVANGQIDARIAPFEEDGASEADLRKHLADALAEAREHLPQGRLAGVGMAWPAAIGRDGEPRDMEFHKNLINPETQEPVQLRPLLEGALENANFARPLAEPRAPLAIQLINDADADLLNEVRYGKARGAHGAIGVKICGGLGMAIMSHGRLVRGHSWSAGEIQHIRVRWEDAAPNHNSLIKALANLDDCWCGGKSCIARFATGKAIIDQLPNVVPGASYNERGGKLERDHKRDIVTTVFERVGGLLGEALLGPVLMLDPECVVISAFPCNEQLLAGIRTVLKPANRVQVEEDKILLSTNAGGRTAAGAGRLLVEQHLLRQIESSYFSKGTRAKRAQLPLHLRVQVPLDEKQPERSPPSY